VQSAALSLQSGKRVYKIESCDLSEIVNGTSEAWRSNFDHAKVKLIINKNDEQIKGKFDAEMIAVMIDNLLDNALRHTILNINNLKDKTATVTVGMQLSGGMADMVISDMGGGIPVKERKLVFSQFRKLKADAGTGATGLGLGLALVKEIAEAHGGSVTIADNEIGGSIISINLKMEN
jgi:signal transduction histidine kinase